MSLPMELRRIINDIGGYASEYGLDPFEIIFELIDANQINEIAAYGGFPTRYPHWKWGMSYDQLSKGHEWGLSKIYEMVINTDPCYAYLLRANNLVDQKTVIAHVNAHSDFFRHNYYFSVTNRKMLDQMANNSTRIRRLIDRFGEDEVEEVIDICLSVENLVDVHFPYRVGKKDPTHIDPEEGNGASVMRLKSKTYMDKYVNPPEIIEKQMENQRVKDSEKKKFPENPVRDILSFIMEYSRLDSWKKEIVGMIREEAYYFAPQAMTKIMNEGWATYWHSKIMTEKVLKDSEIVDFADAHSGVVATSPGQLNPYKMGVELYKHIENRWDKGRFGLDYLNCDDYSKKKNWDTGAMQGREKIFKVRSYYNDITFIDEFLDEEFANDQKLYVYGLDPRTGQYVIVDRDWRKIKRQLLDQLTNTGNPIIEIEDGNYRNRGYLLLQHQYLGVEIQLNYAHKVLQNLEKLWTRPIALKTVLAGKPIKLFCEEGKVIEEKPD